MGRATKRNLRRPAQDLPRCGRALQDDFPQALPLQKLRHHVGHTVVRAHVVHSQDVRMVQGRDRASLLLETLQSVPVSDNLLVQDLDKAGTSESK